MPLKAPGPRLRAFAAFASMSVLAACSSASSTTPAATTPERLALPLASSVDDLERRLGRRAGGRFLGALRQPTNGTRWSNVTPPGVGDSGGLVVGIAPDESLTAGFLPSDLLKFSPLERTNDGISWTPGLLPGALASGPDVLSVGIGRTAWAVLASAGGKVVTTSDNGSTWRDLVDEHQLAGTAAGQACGTTVISAVADVGPSAGLLAATCTRSGVVGILEGPGPATAHRWILAGPTLPTAIAHGQVQVLRLTGAPGHLFVLLAVAAGSGAVNVIAAWSDGIGHPWHVSEPLSLAEGGSEGDIVSAGPIGVPGRPAEDGPMATVLIKRPGGSLEIEQLPGPTASWRLLPSTPARTVALAQAAGGPLEALAVQGQFVQIWSHDPGSAYWKRVQTIFVPPGSV